MRCEVYMQIGLINVLSVRVRFQAIGHICTASSFVRTNDRFKKDSSEAMNIKLISYE